MAKKVRELEFNEQQELYHLKILTEVQIPDLDR